VEAGALSGLHVGGFSRRGGVYRPGMIISSTVEHLCPPPSSAGDGPGMITEATVQHQAAYGVWTR
jgi:hypothetical protein